ncbi:MAG: hypothetical protein JNN04_12895 [Cyclobacteriaceae bacterium]|nr:hypothetical protein [Cyclobacteriaceae bacterium]
MRGIIPLFIILSQLNCVAQTYSKVVPDSIVEAFVFEVLHSKEPYSSIFNKLPKRIYNKPIHIGSASWTFETDTAFQAVFKILYTGEHALPSEDVVYIQKQYYGIKESAWAFKSSNLKFKKKRGRRIYEYSIPLFTKDHDKAIFWRYWSGGPLYAYSELHLYSRINGVWKIDKILAGWIS